MQLQNLFPHPLQAPHTCVSSLVLYVYYLSITHTRTLTPKPKDGCGLRSVILYSIDSSQHTVKIISRATTQKSTTKCTRTKNILGKLSDFVLLGLKFSFTIFKYLIFSEQAQTETLICQGNRLVQFAWERCRASQRIFPLLHLLVCIFYVGGAFCLPFWGCIGDYCAQALIWFAGGNWPRVADGVWLRATVSRLETSLPYYLEQM